MRVILKFPVSATAHIHSSRYDGIAILNLGKFCPIQCACEKNDDVVFRHGSVTSLLQRHEANDDVVSGEEGGGGASAIDSQPLIMIFL